MSKARKPPAPRPTVRCAIYTRKSTEEGLEQEFNSLDAQRESGEAYIKSQTHEGWECLPAHYDDGGFTGGNMERPALKRLLADIETGKIDCVVVYKVDRLSRSLLDFARIMETFEKQQVSFVSVTQQFNTAARGPACCLILGESAFFVRIDRTRAGLGMSNITHGHGLNRTKRPGRGGLTTSTPTCWPCQRRHPGDVPPSHRGGLLAPAT